MERIKRCQDLMLGIAIGDAFGAGYENLSGSQVTKDLNTARYNKYPFNSGHEAGHYTDDTQMAIAVAKTLYSMHFDAPNLANSFLEEYKANRVVGYSKDMLSLLQTSDSPENFLRRAKPSEQNGAVMRVVPIGVLQDIEKVKEYSIINAQVSHNTGSAIASSVAVALASHYFFNNLGQPSEIFDFCLGNMKNMKEFDRESLEYLIEVSKMDGLKPEILFGQEHQNYGVPTHGLKTAGAVLYILAQYSDNPMEALKQAVLLGGDTDTTASICLGIIYSRMPKGLNQFLFDNLQNGDYGKDYILSIGTRLATVLPMDIQTIRRLNYPGERKSMIVQTLDGLLETLNPTYLDQIMKQLFYQIKYEPNDIILAVDASGYIPATAASMVTGLNLVASKKVELDIPNKVCFYEPGAPNPNIFVYSIPDNSRVIIVDDEIMTGRTIINASKALKNRDHKIVAVVVPVESTKYNVRKELADLGIPLISHTKHSMG